MKLLTLQFSPVTLYVYVKPVRTDRVPQRHVPERPQPLFFPYCERLSLMCSFMCFNVYICG
jgi:hypothetical protein